MAGPTNGGRARAFAALRESEALHRAVLTNISDAVFVTDDGGRFTFVCPNVDAIFGYVTDEVHAMGGIGHLLGDALFDPAELTAKREILNLEREVTSKSGARRIVLINVKRVDISGGTVLFACRDITERKTAEEQVQAARLTLAHASRLALVGQLVTSIVNELNQPLTAIATNASAGVRLLDRGGALDQAALRDLVEDVRTQSHAAASVIERLQTLTRQQPFELEPVDVNEALRELLRVIDRETRRRGVTVRSQLAPGVLRVTGDRGFLQQALSHLLLNAVEAIEQRDDNRIVTVRTRRRRDEVEITVSDSGPGIPPEHVSRLFESFFTTKTHGVGLGLSIARSLIEALDGRLALVEAGATGATFRVTLPTKVAE